MRGIPGRITAVPFFLALDQECGQCKLFCFAPFGAGASFFAAEISP